MINSKGDRYCYLNARHTLETAAVSGGAGFFSKLHQLLINGNQGKAPPKQWASMIRALQTKGVKRSELEDSKILESLETSIEKSLTKEQVAGLVLSGLPTVKELELKSPRYAAWRHPGGDYKELLYVLNSQRDNVQDELSELEYRLEAMQYDAADLAFSLESLMDDPELPGRMQAQMKALRDLLPKAWDYETPHFRDALDGTVDKNIMAHARITERGSLFFVEEIQSDWAQAGGKASRRAAREAVISLLMTRLGDGASYGDRQFLESAIRSKATVELRGVKYDPKDPEMIAAAEEGRKAGWSGSTPAAPFVTNTEEWSGLILRRLIQRAAAIPAVNQFAWITQSMRNGGRAGGSASLDDFYKNILPSWPTSCSSPWAPRSRWGR